MWEFPLRLTAWAGQTALFRGKTKRTNGLTTVSVPFVDQIPSATQIKSVTHLIEHQDKIAKALLRALLPVYHDIRDQQEDCYPNRFLIPIAIMPAASAFGLVRC